MSWMNYFFHLLQKDINVYYIVNYCSYTSIVAYYMCFFKNKHLLIQPVIAKTHRFLLVLRLTIWIDFQTVPIVLNSILKQISKNRWILMCFGANVLQNLSFFFLTNSHSFFSVIKTAMMNLNSRKAPKKLAMWHRDHDLGVKFDLSDQQDETSNT